jgi:prepilin-type N-terminal cleavage/methylation domain-containing protein
MKCNYKSRKGFTLIELLVVIGILAVLAAIAIPSVAGLIDRANVSADNTNSNEMTNSVERFASEYELYCQDIASGKIKDATNLDSAQARVYNVTKALSRSDIEKLESEEGFNGRAIDKDTKYPINVETARAIMQVYEKN